MDGKRSLTQIRGAVSAGTEQCVVLISCIQAKPRSAVDGRRNEEKERETGNERLRSRERGSERATYTVHEHSPCKSAKMAAPISQGNARPRALNHEPLTLIPNPRYVWIPFPRAVVRRWKIVKCCDPALLRNSPEPRPSRSQSCKGRWLNLGSKVQDSGSGFR